MTPAQFKKQLSDHGFTYERSAHGGRFLRVAGGLKQYVARESVRGSAWRLCLGVGEAPAFWPAIDPLGKAAPDWVEAESPWFNYFTDLDPTDPLDAQCDSRETALEKCFQWLTTRGFEWLAGPEAKSRDEWRKTYKILQQKRADEI